MRTIKQMLALGVDSVNHEGGYAPWVREFFKKEPGDLNECWEVALRNAFLSGSERAAKIIGSSLRGEVRQSKMQESSDVRLEGDKAREDVIRRRDPVQYRAFRITDKEVADFFMKDST